MNTDDLAELSERAAHIVAGGGGLKALAQALADAAGGAVLIEDDQWRHLALAQGRKPLSHVPPTFAQWYKPAANSNGQISRVSIDATLHAACAPIITGGDREQVPGFVTLFVRAKPAQALIAALRIIAGAAGIELARRGAGRAHVRRAFWERYLSGEWTDAAALKEEATSTGIALPVTFLGAVFDVEGAPPGSARDAVAQAIAPADGFCPIAPTPGQVVALFGMRHSADVARARQAAHNAVRDVPAMTGARSVSCGIGGYHADLVAGPASVDEARRSLALGRRLYGRGSVTLHDELGVYALLHAGGDREAFRRFAEAQLAPLQTYDRKHKTDLLQTLRLYFEIGENVKEAAERLSVHRHTIFYRLNQISQILKVDLHQPKDQLSLRAALAIWQMEPEAE